MPVHIWVRATVDWADEEAFLAQVSDAFRPKVEAWNATFTLPFHIFRHRVREIARLNLAAVDCAVVVEDWERIPDGAVVLPVDDDDWFAPGVAAAVLAARGPEIVRWRSTWIEVPMSPAHAVGRYARETLPGVPSFYDCTTNNYAVVKRPVTKRLAASHVRAHHRVREQPGGALRIAGRLSAMNRTLASQTTLGLRRPIRRGELVAKHALYRRLYGRGRVPRGVEWARPYVERMAALMDELDVRR